MASSRILDISKDSAKYQDNFPALSTKTRTQPHILEKKNLRPRTIKPIRLETKQNKNEKVKCEALKVEGSTNLSDIQDLDKIKESSQELDKSKCYTVKTEKGIQIK